MTRFRLQFRIVILIASLSLLLIFVFTTMQLRHQLDQLRSYNKYRARVGTIIVRTTLETVLGAVQTDEAFTGIFNAAVASFSKEGVVDKISILTTKGAVVASNDPLVRKFGETTKDIETYFRLSKQAGRGAWFFSTINDKTQNIDIFIPLTIRPGLAYIAKLSFSIGNIHDAFIDILVPIGLTAFVVIMVNIVLGFILSRTVVYPIKILNAATKDIASGNLERMVKIVTRDEIQELGETFNVMTVALKKMKEKAEDASPLTHLPGNNMIRGEVEKRIQNELTFTAIHTDLDNFKAYNDKYGISKGDDVIKFTGDVLKTAVKEEGNEEDFVGHEGGDDFYVITTPEKAQGVADKIISGFDSRIRDFYSKEDQKQGFITEKDRKGMAAKFPIMTISLAGVSNQYRHIDGYGELTNIEVGLKKKAKESAKSIFILDRRRSAR